MSSVISDFENEDLAPLSQLALRIQLASTGIATSLILLFIPNIETITFFCFFFGFIFSFRYALSTTMTMVLGWEIVISMILSFSGITFFFKILAWFIITLFGNLARKMHVTKSYEFAFLGALSSLMYDIIVTLAIPIFFVSSSGAFMPVFLTYFVFGLPFTIIHVLSNLLLFGLFPKLVSSVIPLFEIKFPNFIKITEKYFYKGKQYAFAIFIGFLIISTVILSGIYFTPKEAETQEVAILINIHYAGVRIDESHSVVTLTNISFLEATLLVANVSVSYEFLGAPYVEAINDVWEYQNLAQYSWLIYLNNAQLPVDVGKSLALLNVQDNDVVLWNYEPTI